VSMILATRLPLEAQVPGAKAEDERMASFLCSLVLSSNARLQLRSPKPSL
jgi:hypothetical protein